MKQVILLATIVGLLFVFSVGFAHKDVENSITTKEQLGEKLFFDPILSVDKTVSCASCHKPEFGFADTVAFSPGVNGKTGRRNTPSVTNLSGRPSYFWDGRASTLEEQAEGPLLNPDEMALPSIDEALRRLKEDPTYSETFKRLYKTEPTKFSLLNAIALFQRTLETANSPYDRFINGDDAALSESAKRGRLLFIGKANCNNCHSGEDFTADRFKNIGLFDGNKYTDSGRYEVTKDPALVGFFKIPGLRNVALSPPYMHNGMFTTLKEVVAYYNTPDAIIKNGGGGKRDLSLDQPLNLNETEINDLVAFIESLTDDRFLTK